MPGTYVLNCGNRRSVIKALEHLGAEVIGRPGDYEIDRIIIPGVGTMQSVMDAIAPIRMWLDMCRNMGKPILGICAGMHAIFEHSEEGDCQGLGWMPGVIRKLPEPTPRQGWRKISEGCVYFSHSYSIEGDEAAHGFICGNLVGTQFHPEKSQVDGLKFLKWFLSWTP